MQYESRTYAYHVMFHLLTLLPRALSEIPATLADDKIKRATQLKVSGGTYTHQLWDEDCRLLENETYVLDGF